MLYSRLKTSIALCGLMLALTALPARAQLIGYTSPQTSIQTAFTNVNTAQTFLPRNLGQNFHVLNCRANGQVSAILRLEGSRDGVTFFAISEDGRVNSAAGQTVDCMAYAIGSFTVLRVNLVEISGTGTLSATYSGTSGAGGSMPGLYSAAQKNYKTIVSNVPANTNFSVFLASPTNSSLGAAVIIPDGNLPAGGLLQVNAPNGTSRFFTSAGGVNPEWFLYPHINSGISGNAEYGVQWVNPGATAVRITVIYFFLPPDVLTTAGGSPALQPASLSNAFAPLLFGNRETTSLANTAQTFTTGAFDSRVNLYSVSAWCDPAGTAQLTVQPLATTRWSSSPGAVTAVGLFRKQWNPPIVAPGLTVGGATLVKVSSCGVGNVSHLAVQVSTF